MERAAERAEPPQALPSLAAERSIRLHLLRRREGAGGAWGDAPPAAVRR